MGTRLQQKQLGFFIHQRNLGLWQNGIAPPLQGVFLRVRIPSVSSKHKSERLMSSLTVRMILYGALAQW